MPSISGWLAAGANLLLLLLLLAVVAVAAEIPPYQEVIVTFEQIKPCEAWMFPEEWTRILNEAVALIGITHVVWVHGYDSSFRGRNLQEDSGCPDWCQYFKQYCDCGCVSTCGDDGDDDDDDDDDDDTVSADDDDRRKLVRRDPAVQAQPDFDKLQDEHSFFSRRTAQVAQFILDEETALHYIEINLEHLGICVECLNQTQARVYLIS